MWFSMKMQLADGEDDEWGNRSKDEDEGEKDVTFGYEEDGSIGGQGEKMVEKGEYKGDDDGV